MTQSSSRTSRIRVGACLSLSGKFARFGTQAAHGLHVWQADDGGADLIIEDDQSDPRVLAALLPRVAARSDVLLGPYSTQLMRTAGDVAAERDWLLWNQGGSGDDVEAAHPGHVVSILAPTSRYAEPFLHTLADESERARLVVVHGKGRFGRQVAAGTERLASHLGIDVVRVSADEKLPTPAGDRWDLFSVGQFEDDVALVRRTQSLANPPRHICSVAAGVRDFSQAVDDTTGVFGIAQWFPGANVPQPELGPPEEEFVSAYDKRVGAPADYPAAQAAAGAIVAAHCVRRSSGVRRGSLWSAAVDLDTTTLYGGFKIDPYTGVQIKHQTTLIRWGTTAPTAI